nr:unnamed protein product [Callosobruchus chinensis]
MSSEDYKNRDMKSEAYKR